MAARVDPPTADAGRPWGFATTPSLDELGLTASDDVRALMQAAEEPRPQADGVEQGAAASTSGRDGDSGDGSGQHVASAGAGDARVLLRGYACQAFAEALANSRTFCSPQCEGAMADALGLGHLYEGLLGSSVAPLPTRAGLERLRGLFRGRINQSWSLEAVKQGVAYAKQGRAGGGQAGGGRCGPGEGGGRGGGGARRAERAAG